MMAELLSMGFATAAVQRVLERHSSVQSAAHALIEEQSPPPATASTCSPSSSSSGGGCSTDPAPASPAAWNGGAADGLLQLPPELLARVLAYASFQQLSSLRQTCRALDSAAAEEAVTRTRRRLGEALATGFKADGLSVPAAKLAEVSARLETALCLQKRPKKFRQILFNIRDAKNPEIRGGLLSGAISPEALLRMGAKDMACSALQQQRSEWKQKEKKRCIRPDWRESMPKSTSHICESCGGNVTRVHRVRAAGRMAVDRVRTYATCVSCNARWET